MKRLLKRKLLGIPILAILVVALIVPTIVLAVGWPRTDLTTTGTITVEASQMTYKISTTVIDFGAPVATSETGFSFDSNIITVKNTGAEPIHEFKFAQVEGVPVGLTFTPLIEGEFPLLEGQVATFKFRVGDTAPVGLGTIELGGITVTLTLN